MTMTLELLTKQDQHAEHRETDKRPKGMLLSLATLFRNASSVRAITEQDKEHFAVTKETRQIPQRIDALYTEIQSFSKTLDTVVSVIDSRAKGISEGKEYMTELSKLTMITDSEHIIPYLTQAYERLTHQATSSAWKQKTREDPDLQESIDATLHLLDSTVQKISSIKRISRAYQMSFIAEEAFFYDQQHTFFQGEAPSLSHAYMASETMKHMILQSVQDRWFSRVGSPVTREDIMHSKEMREAQQKVEYEVGTSIFYGNVIEKTPLDLINSPSNRGLYHTLTGESFADVIRNIPYTGCDITVSQSEEYSKRERHIRNQTRQTLDKILTTSYQTAIIRAIGAKDKETQDQMHDSLANLVGCFQKQFYSETGTKRSSAYMDTLEAGFREAGLDETKQMEMTIFSFAYYLRYHGSARTILSEGSAVKQKKVLADFTAYTIHHSDALIKKYDSAQVQEFLAKKRTEKITDDSIDFLRLYNHIHILSENAYHQNKKKTTILFSAKDINPK